MVGDYYNNEPHSLLAAYYLTNKSGGNQPIPDAIWVNGAVRRPNLPVASYEVYNVSRSSAKVFDLIVASASTMFQLQVRTSLLMLFQVDGCSLTLLELDGVEIEPYSVGMLFAHVGQRVKFSVDFNELPNATHAVYLCIEAMVEDYPLYTTAYVPFYETDASTVLC
jgi:hypothetical protein